MRFGVTSRAALVSVFGIIVTASIAGYFVLNQQSNQSAQTTTAGVFKVALVSIGGPSTTWNLASLKGINDTTNLLKNENIVLQISTNLDTTPADAVKVFTGYAEGGYDLVIGDSVIYESALKETAPLYPKVHFLGVAWSGNTTANLSVYGWNMWEGYYPAGVLAALATKTGVLGFVTAFEFPLTAAHYNAFVQGAKSVNSNIKVPYVFTGDWSDPTKGASAAQALISQGADVIAGVGDGMTDGVIRQAETSGVLAIGYIYDQNDVAPNAVLTSVVWQKTKYFYDAIKAILSNNFGNREFNYGIYDKIVALAPYHSLDSKLTAEQKAKVEGVLNELYEGKLRVEFVPAFPK